MGHGQNVVQTTSPNANSETILPNVRKPKLILLSLTEPLKRQTLRLNKTLLQNGPSLEGPSLNN